MGFRTPQEAASLEEGLSLPDDTPPQGGDDSSSIGSLSPIGMVKSADLAPTDAQTEAEVIEAKAVEAEAQNSKTIQPPDDPLNDDRRSQASPICIGPKFSKQNTSPTQAILQPAPLHSSYHHLPRCQLL